MGEYIGKNISNNLNDKYSQIFLDRAKQSATDALKTASKRSIQKTAEASDYLISSTIADKFLKVSKTSPQTNSETVANEHDKENPIEKSRKKSENY